MSMITILIDSYCDGGDGEIDNDNYGEYDDNDRSDDDNDDNDGDFFR